MRRFFQYILFCAVALSLLTACEKDDVTFAPDSPYIADAEAGEVLLVLSDGATRANYEGMTRAMVANDGNLIWQSGDRFRLYAKNGDGSNAFPSNDYIDFLYWINTTDVPDTDNNKGGRSFFKGKIDGSMANGSYTYYAVYPHNTPVDGTTATFSLPALQDGKYGKTDFMIARSTSAALQVCDDDPETPIPLNNLDIVFKHQLHALRFEIPNTGVLSSGIRRVHILFSEAVVGDIKVDMANNTVVSTANTSNKITVDFGEGGEKQAGETFWVMTLPQAAFSRAVDIRFEDSDGNFTTRQLVTFPSSQQYTAGHLTPIKMNVPSEHVGYTYLDVTTDDTQLGEPVTYLQLELPEGYYFTDYSRKYIASENGEIHTFAIFNDVIDNTLRVSPITLTYESENALIPTTYKFGDGLKLGQRNKHELTTPWLFEQNFENASNIDSDQEDSAMSGVLEGWTGSRFGVEKAVKMHIYQGTSTSSIDNKRSRVDSSTLPYLKPDANVSVKVVCNYGGTLAKGTLSNPKIMQSVIEIGATMTGGVISQDVGLDNTYFSVDAGSNGSYTNTPNTATVTIPNFTASHRISWRGTFRNHSGSRWSTITALYVYAYFDNVRVSIAQ